VVSSLEPKSEQNTTVTQRHRTNEHRKRQTQTDRQTDRQCDRDSIITIPVRGAIKHDEWTAAIIGNRTV